MIVYYDPLDKNCKSVTGGIEENAIFTLKIDIPEATSCSVVIRSDGKSEERVFAMIPSNGAFTAEISLGCGLYWYHFKSDVGDVGKGDNGLAVFCDYPKSYQLTVYKKSSYPTGFYGGIIYQIMPDRFCRAKGFGNAEGKKMRSDWGGMPEYLPDDRGKILNDDFFGGNFEGIRQKLRYLQRLGVTHVYLNPIAKSHSNHRYDTADYMSIDPLLGTEDDLKRLIQDGKELGITFIFDGVYNHTGDDSIYFNKYKRYGDGGAYNDRNSAYAQWYEFKNYPDEYACWWGIDVLPTIRKDCKEFQDFIAGDGGVIDKYMSLGFGGVRLDVVDELSDEFVARIRNKVKQYGEDKIIIGEVWEDATNKIAYGVRRKYFLGEELDSVMNYPLKDAVIEYVLSGNGKALEKTVKEQIDHYPSNALNGLMNIIGTHDTPRILTVLGKCGKLKIDRSDMAYEILTAEEKREAVKKLKCASAIQFFIYGVPSIYYGDECGMEGNKDPFNRKCFEIEKADGNVLDWYKKITSLRKSCAVFSGGETVDVKSDGGVFSFKRKTRDEEIMFVANCGFSMCEVRLNCSTDEIINNIKTDKITLNTYDFAVFYKRVKQ